MLSNESGRISHKRVLGTIGFVSLIATMFANSLTKLENVPSSELINAVEYLTMSTVFGSVIEKFTKTTTNN